MLVIFTGAVAWGLLLEPALRGFGLGLALYQSKGGQSFLEIDWRIVTQEVCGGRG